MPILADNGFRWVAATSQEIYVGYMGGFGETDGVRRQDSFFLLM